MAFSLEMAICQEGTKFLDNIKIAMNFGISIEIDSLASHKSEIIQNLSNKLFSFFEDKYYGESINIFTIGCICIKAIPDYEEWYKIRSPKYKETETIKLLDGRKLELKKTYVYDIKFNEEEYNKFIKSEVKEAENMIAKKIIDSLSYLDKMPKKINDFDKERFKHDLITYFKSNGLLDRTAE